MLLSVRKDRWFLTTNGGHAAKGLLGIRTAEVTVCLPPYCVR
ncbi:hypothetical protein [Cymbidium ringspot virus satellite RNA]|uniref:Uncharacterized protein n=1 Tax=Cymbidium ringspot virus satellite RNA TaxID=192023 RepID=Q66228_9VIRU|nr:hypothetical protein CrvsRgp1 [Cymbidium ringspot virus satellite RNA]BAA00622.1 hypothetical protein [Cymbidium ringspot virus satellite RNA]